MKIVSWNCAGKFREDYEEIFKQNADIYVIPECEDPDEDLPKYKKYLEGVGENHRWAGNIHYKGLGIFAKKGVTLEDIELNGKCEHFLAVRVNNSFNLLAVWAMGKDKEKGLNPYVEMIHDFLDDNKDNKKLFDGGTIIMCGDFNSSHVFNGHHKTKDNNGDPKNHDCLNKKLNDFGLFSVYHELTKEKSGEETKMTFFQARHLNDPYHLDYVFTNKELIDNTTFTKNGKKVKKGLPNEFEILDKGEWITLSDHLPLVFKFDLK